MMTILATTTTAQSIDFSSLVQALSSMVSFADVLSFLALGLGVAGSFFLGWMGVRKLVKLVTGAIKSGKIKV